MTVTVSRPEDMPPLSAWPEETQRLVMDILYRAYQRKLKREREEAEQKKVSNE